MLAVYKKELKGFYTNMLGYVFSAFLLVVAGLMIMTYCLGGTPQNTYEYIYGGMPIIYIIIIPILAMNSIAGEMRNKTDQLLYTSPVGISKIVAGKYFAMCTVLFIPLLITGIYPFLLRYYGNISIATSLSSMAVFFLLGCALIAICMFISSLTESQILSAVISFGVLFLLYTSSSLQYYISRSPIASAAFFAVIAAIIGYVIFRATKSKLVGISCGLILLIGVAYAFAAMPDALKKAASTMINYIAMFKMIENFIYGIFDVSVIVYYLSICLFFTYLCVQSIDKRRWN